MNKPLTINNQQMTFSFLLQLDLLDLKAKAIVVKNMKGLATLRLPSNNDGDELIIEDNERLYSVYISGPQAPITLHTQLDELFISWIDGPLEFKQLDCPRLKSFTYNISVTLEKVH